MIEVIISNKQTYWWGRKELYFFFRHV